MSNQSIAIRRIPTSLDGWNFFTDGKNVFHLSDMNGIAGGLNDIDNSATGAGGSILVERVAVRMDIRDGSPVWAADKKDENIARYHVVHLT